MKVKNISGTSDEKSISGISWIRLWYEFLYGKEPTEKINLKCCNKDCTAGNDNKQKKADIEKMNGAHVKTENNMSTEVSNLISNIKNSGNMSTEVSNLISNIKNSGNMSTEVSNVISNIKNSGNMSTEVSNVISNIKNSGNMSTEVSNLISNIKRTNNQYMTVLCSKCNNSANTEFMNVYKKDLVRLEAIHKLDSKKAAESLFSKDWN